MDTKILVKDPVCGMEIDPHEAVAVRELKGQELYFCSDNCVKQFDAGQEKQNISKSGLPQPVSIPSATTGVSGETSGPVRLELPVRGLNRSSGASLAKILQAVPGVYKAHVNVRSGKATLEYDPARGKVTDFVDTIRSAGYTTGGQSIRLKVSGLYCSECVVKIEDALKATPGVFDATMNAATNSPLVMSE